MTTSKQMANPEVQADRERASRGRTAHLLQEFLEELTCLPHGTAGWGRPCPPDGTLGDENVRAAAAKTRRRPAGASEDGAESYRT